MPNSKALLDGMDFWLHELLPTRHLLPNCTEITISDCTVRWFWQRLREQGWRRERPEQRLLHLHYLPRSLRKLRFVRSRIYDRQGDWLSDLIAKLEKRRVGGCQDCPPLTYFEWQPTIEDIRNLMAKYLFDNACREVGSPKIIVDELSEMESSSQEESTNVEDLFKSACSELKKKYMKDNSVCVTWELGTDGVVKFSMKVGKTDNRERKWFED